MESDWHCWIWNILYTRGWGLIRLTPGFAVYPCVMACPLGSSSAAQKSKEEDKEMRDGVLDSVQNNLWPGIPKKSYTNFMPQIKLALFIYFSECYGITTALFNLYFWQNTVNFLTKFVSRKILPADLSSSDWFKPTARLLKGAFPAADAFCPGAGTRQARKRPNDGFQSSEHANGHMSAGRGDLAWSRPLDDIGLRNSGQTGHAWWNRLDCRQLNQAADNR